MLDNESNSTEDHEPTWEEVRPWAEFCCWTTLVMAPIINWLNGPDRRCSMINMDKEPVAYARGWCGLNGPAVSDDQYVVRTGLIVLAA